MYISKQLRKIVNQRSHELKVDMQNGIDCQLKKTDISNAA